jgi:hypothetical protein
MKALGQQTFIIRTDSKVIQEHIEKESEARNPVLMKYLEKSQRNGKTFQRLLSATHSNRWQQRSRQTSESGSQKSRNAS